MPYNATTWVDNVTQTLAATMNNIESGIVAALRGDVLTAKGDLYVASAASTPARLGVGTDGQVLTADSTAASGTKWTGPFELRGTGQPESVVTAPPGTYYTDTAGTAGAWRWLKTTGTGNTGWVTALARSGVRTLYAANAVMAVSQVTAEAVHVSRDGNVVSFVLGIVVATGYVSGSTIMTLPLGFRPASQPYMPNGYGGVGSIVNSNGDIKYYGGATGGARWQWAYYTTDPWPTVLP